MSQRGLSPAKKTLLSQAAFLILNRQARGRQPGGIPVQADRLILSVNSGD